MKDVKPAAGYFRKSLLCRVLALGLIPVLMITAFLCGGQLGISARTHKRSEQLKALMEAAGKTENENLFTMLFLGIDRSAERDAESLSGEYEALADTIVVAVADLERAEMTLLSIPRDTVVDVKVYSAQDIWYNTVPGQIALQYVYGGAGDAQRAGHMAEAVSELLHGVPIDAVAVVDMDAVAELATLLGGIPVTIPDDEYYCAYTGYTPGQWVLLEGEAALQFVQYRDIAVFASCEMRIERQKVFLRALIERALLVLKAAPLQLLRDYRAAAQHLYTDLSASECTVLALRMASLQADQLTFATLPGQVAQGWAYEEFYVDDAQLQELLFALFACGEGV